MTDWSDDPKVWPYSLPGHPLNGPEYRTGKTCVGYPRGSSCDKPAGTWWSPYWCQACNTKRLDAINTSLQTIVDRHVDPEQTGFNF